MAVKLWISVARYEETFPRRKLYARVTLRNKFNLNLILRADSSSSAIATTWRARPASRLILTLFAPLLPRSFLDIVKWKSPELLSFFSTCCADRIVISIGLVFHFGENARRNLAEFWPKVRKSRGKDKRKRWNFSSSLIAPTPIQPILDRWHNQDV